MSPATATLQVPYVDLALQHRALKTELLEAAARVIDSGQFILGPQVEEFEKLFAGLCGVKYAVAVSNGTDALMIVLRAWNVGPGDAVFVPAFTFAASAEVVALVGASPVFVDVLEDTYNFDSASLEAAIALVKREGKLKAKALITVDLFGRLADYPALQLAAGDRPILADACQAAGAKGADGREEDG